MSSITDLRRPTASSLLGCAIGLLTWLIAQPVAAQSSKAATPTASQAEVFRNLPADQQRAILQSMGKGGVGTLGQKRIDFPQSSVPKESKDDSDPLALKKAPMLRGGDTVIVDVWLRETDDTDGALGRIDLLTDKEAAKQAANLANKVTTPNAVPTVDEHEAKRLRDRKREEQRLNQRTPEQLAALKKLRELVLAGNPYRLDKSGALSLRGFRAIALAGLTEQQATQRLNAEPALLDFRMRVALLPLERQGVDALEPFGYDLFATAPSTFAPVTDVPVPSSYTVGPGDELQIKYIGKGKDDFSLQVDRSGQITLPEIGAISVSGMRFENVRALIEARVAEQLIGTRVVVSMGELRAIQVVIAGDAEQPGAYTLSPLSTITAALLSAGGVKRIGSLRDIQLRRGGAVVARLDLYDLLLRGETSGDVPLLSGDVIFIPPIGAAVSIAGEVIRPAIYELKPDATAADLLFLAGGLTPDADPRHAALERIEGRRERVMMDIDLSVPAGRATRLRAGDIVQLRGVPAAVRNSISIGGHVQRPATVGYRSGLRIADVLPNVRELLENADLNYVLVRREREADRSVSAVSADLEAAWASPESDANVPLAPGDQITVFNLTGGRELSLKPILDDLRRQAVRGRPTQIVSIGGRVRTPGDYPLEPGMKVSDLVRAGGSLGEAAYGGTAEITRFTVASGESREARTIPVDLARVLAGDPAANLALEPSDFLVIKELPQWTDVQTVTLGGEVRFPGKYPIKRGERLSSVLQRAGGLSDLAFASGTVFTREELKERERKQIEALAERLQRDIGAAALASTQTVNSTPQRAQDALAVGETLLDSLRDAKPVGRLVIDLPRALAAPGSSADVVLKGGDTLLVPAQAQEVTVLGEVPVGTSHVFDASLSRNDYIQMSGGVTQKADRKGIYVVRANGSVVAGSSSLWFRKGQDIRPGDTIIVPLSAERLPPLPFWSAVSTIIYNLAVATAAVKSF